MCSARASASDGVAGGQRLLSELVDGDFEREVPRTMAPTTPTGSVPHLSSACSTTGHETRPSPEIGLPRKVIDQSRQVFGAPSCERGIQTCGAVGHRAGQPTSRMSSSRNSSSSPSIASWSCSKAALAKSTIGRPVRCCRTSAAPRRSPGSCRPSTRRTTCRAHPRSPG